jgi:3'-phosphoadenosine 5'-phosphosulfate sulfotransferase (PAPS reductase)/FAD synthetase
MNLPVIAWWSGGITSALACKITLDLFKNVRVVFIDTRNEDADTYRFKADCERWYGCSIETITSEHYGSIEDVWKRFKGMNFANGAICSTELKRAVRIEFERHNEYLYQVFGFEFETKEFQRALAMAENYPSSKPIFPLLMYGIDKKQALQMVEQEGIKIPDSYLLGFSNNNCLMTGCVQGGIGYWQKFARTFPDRFDKMAAMEHELSEMKGRPVTMLKDRRNGKDERLFLKKHPLWPEIAELSETKGREPEPLTDCGPFGCAVNDRLPRPKTELEINFEKE